MCYPCICHPPKRPSSLFSSITLSIKFISRHVLYRSSICARDISSLGATCMLAVVCFGLYSILCQLHNNTHFAKIRLAGTSAQTRSHEWDWRNMPKLNYSRTVSQGKSRDCSLFNLALSASTRALHRTTTRSGKARALGAPRRQIGPAHRQNSSSRLRLLFLAEPR